MTDFLLNSIVPLTLLMLAVLLLRHMFTRHVGVTLSYYSWGLVPLGLLAYHFPLPIVANFASAPVSIDIYQIVSNSVPNDTMTLSAMLLGVWALGLATFISYVAISHVQFYKQLSLVKHEDMSQRLPVEVYYSEAVYSPFLLGLWRPKLVLPEEFSTLYNEEQQRLIIAHELCHYQRKDMWWNLLACSVVACFWFHPLVWWSYRYFRQDQEYSCDFAVLARTQRSCRINYSKALVITAESTPPSTFALLSFNEYGERNMMMNRIQLIKNDKRTSLRAAVTAGATMLMLLTTASYAGNSMLGESGAKGVKSKSAELSPVMRVEPIYPDQAIKQKLEGSVLLQFDIDADGTTENISVIKAEPSDIFNKSARRALKKWQYNANGKRHEGQLVQLDFLLGQGSAKRQSLLERIEVQGK
ncbi:M56 family metallopeptidase [Thalassotalea fusca]